MYIGASLSNATTFKRFVSKWYTPNKCVLNGAFFIVFDSLVEDENRLLLSRESMRYCDWLIVIWRTIFDLIIFILLLFNRKITLNYTPVVACSCIFCNVMICVIIVSNYIFV